LKFGFTRDKQRFLSVFFLGNRPFGVHEVELTFISVHLRLNF
jgi:hypothetical protein